ncbi:hypothetical protein AVEN_7708-1 [Araneus ventricosus]|uniref:Uncharacterized protein n=1 Tax=Araneus ventricosus TaxID=182803 RepID=A0A4Y2JPK3_ARAVE|nr:hypothetical protein AVEN_7708-1 [Araneus ventricosus]
MHNIIFHINKLSRFVSGHLRSCSFSHGNKVFPVCAKCGVASASPERILSCLRLSRESFETDPLLALDFLRVSGLMDGLTHGGYSVESCFEPGTLRPQKQRPYHYSSADPSSRRSLATAYDLTCNRLHARRILNGIGLRTWNPLGPKPRPYYLATVAMLF